VRASEQNIVSSAPLQSQNVFVKGKVLWVVWYDKKHRARLGYAVIKFSQWFFLGFFSGALSVHLSVAVGTENNAFFNLFEHD
jgi:hypothetical protein